MVAMYEAHLDWVIACHIKHELIHCEVDGHGDSDKELLLLKGG